jgi:hypothetical protein
VIDNSGDLDQLEAEVDRVWDWLLERERAMASDGD